MALINEAAKISIGQEFNQKTERATTLIARLSEVKNDLISIKNTMQADTDTYTVDDVAEAIAKLQELQSALNNL